MSKIGLGIARFGSALDNEKASDILNCFIDNGGTLVDTARNYYEWAENGHGKSEEFLGKYIEDNNCRNDIVISTKGGVSNRGTKWDIHLDRISLLDEIKRSKDALRTDYIDIYFLHRDDRDKPVEEIVDTIQEIKDISKAERIGVANWKCDRVIEANRYALRQHYTPFTIVQNWWSLAEYTDSMWNDENCTHMDRDMYEYLLNNKFYAMGYTSQCKGYFHKIVNSGYDAIDDSLKKRIETPTNIKKAMWIKEYCEQKKIPVSAIVNGYITDNKLSGMALVSTTNIHHLKEIMNSSDICIGSEVIEELDGII